MDIRDPLLLAILLAVMVFGLIAFATFSFHDDLTPEYFDTAGKYIHRL